MTVVFFVVDMILPRGATVAIGYRLVPTIAAGTGRFGFDLLDRLARRGPRLLVSTPGREHPAGHDLFDVEAIDLVAGQAPVRGILTSLLNANAPVVVVVPADMPGLAHESISWVAGQLLGRPTVTGVVTQRATELQPFPVAFRRTVASVTHARLEKRLRLVKGLADE